MAKNIEMYVIAVLEYFIIAYDTSVRRSNTDNRWPNSSFLSRICDIEKSIIRVYLKYATPKFLLFETIMHAITQVIIIINNITANIAYY